MILKNNEIWDGWREDLANKLGKTFTLKKDAIFELAGRYAGYRRIGRLDASGRVIEPVMPRISYPLQVAIPLEAVWVDDNGESCLIRWAERVDMVPAGKELMPQYTPESLICRGKTFNCPSNKLDLFWFLYCVSGHCGNGARFDENIVGKRNAELANATRTERILYNHVDVDARIKEERNKREQQAYAIKIVQSMSESRLREMYAALGNNESDTENIDIIYNYMYDIAEKNPQQLILLESQDVSILAIVQKARLNNVIRYIRQTRAWKFSDTEGDEYICLVTKGKNEVDELVHWLRTKDDNGQVLAAIKEKIFGAEKVASATDNV